MKIAIDGLAARMGGGTIYLKSQLEALTRNAPDWSFVLFCVPQNRADLDVHADNLEIVEITSAGRSLMARLAWQQLVFPYRLKGRGFDLLYCPGNLCIGLAPCPQVLTLQNTNPFASLSVRHTLILTIKYLCLRVGSIASIHRAGFTIFISHDYRRQVERFMNLRGVKWDVVYSGVDDIFQMNQSKIGETSLVRPRDYILAVSNFYRHKNYETLFLAFERIFKHRKDSLHLMVAGAAMHKDYFEEMKRLVSRLQAGSHIHLLDAVAHADLPALYSGAHCYVSTSILEAFPLTPFEAMASGLPVVISRATVFPEICEEAAIYFDPLDPVDVANKIELVLDNPSLAEDLVRRGFEQLKKFPWDRNAQRLIEIFDSVAR